MIRGETNDRASVCVSVTCERAALVARASEDNRKVCFSRIVEEKRDMLAAYFNNMVNEITSLPSFA